MRKVQTPALKCSDVKVKSFSHKTKVLNILYLSPNTLEKKSLELERGFKGECVEAERSIERRVTFSDDTLLLRGPLHPDSV